MDKSKTSVILSVIHNLQNPLESTSLHIVAMNIVCMCLYDDRLCGLVVRVLVYRSEDPGSIPITTRKKVVGLERGPLSLVSTTEELLDRKVAAPA
jgi:hypothetical protein